MKSIKAQLFARVFILLFISTSCFAEKPEGELDAGLVNPGYHEKPEWFKNSFLDIDEDVQEAADANKRLMIFFFQDGCPYCQKLLEDNFGTKSIAEKTREHFDLVAVNMWGDRELTYKGKTYTEKQFAELARVMYTPTLLFFNEQGSVVLRVNGYYHPGKFDATLDYVRNKLEGRQKFIEYLAEVSPVKASGQLHNDIETVDKPYHFQNAVKKGKPLVVMFEQAQCKTCDELHLDMLKRPESRTLLEQFEVAVVDIWSTDSIIKPDGKRTRINQWAKDIEVQYAPSMVFFDPQGNEVFRIEGYLKAFHVQSVLDYVVQQAYKEQPNFQRWIDTRAHKLRDMGIEVDLMN